jgi:hypothetical protein
MSEWLGSVSNVYLLSADEIVIFIVSALIFYLAMLFCFLEVAVPNERDRAHTNESKTA